MQGPEECLLVCFFFLNRSPAREEQQRRLLCPLFLWLDLLESSLFKESRSSSLGKEWPVETKVRQPAGELRASEAGPPRPWCVLWGQQLAPRSPRPACDHLSSPAGSPRVGPAAGACGLHAPLRAAAPAKGTFCRGFQAAS